MFLERYQYDGTVRADHGVGKEVIWWVLTFLKRSLAAVPVVYVKYDNAAWEVCW